MLKLLRPPGRPAHLYGPVTLWTAAPPRFAKIMGCWPAFRVIFSDCYEPVCKKVSIQPNGKHFTVSVPTLQTGLPDAVDAEANQGAWTRIDGYTFDFAYIAQTPEDRDGLKSRAQDLLLQFLHLCQQYRDLFGESLETELGIRISDDQDDDAVPVEPLAEPVITAFRYTGGDDLFPNFTHAILRSASINNEAAPTKWNLLLESVIRRINPDDLRVRGAELIPYGFVFGKVVHRSYRYIEDLQISLQWKSAQEIGRRIAKLAIAFDLLVELEFVYVNNEGHATNQPLHLTIAPPQVDG